MMLNNREIIWLFGIFISLAGIPLGVFLADQNTFLAKSYTPLLPSISYIAVTALAVSLLECFELGLAVNKKKLNENVKRKVIIQIMIIIFVAFAYFVGFVSNVSNATKEEYSATWTVLSINSLMVLFAIFLVVRLRRLLEDLA